MKIYFANIMGAKGLEKYLNTKIDVLAAYPAFPKSTSIITKLPFVDNLFLDSGAFTKQRHSIVLKDYVNFIKMNENSLEIYANLDVIGNAFKSWKNQQRMERRGVSPLPVFHYGSKLKWLYLLLEQYDYIALGGLVPITTNKVAMITYLDKIWNIILSTKPDLKVHGFGVHSKDILRRYLWYSVDASSIHMQARYGGILTKWGFIKINPNVNSKEMEWMIKKPLQKEQITNFVEKYANGYSFESASKQDTEGTLLRCAISIHYMLDYVSEIRYTPIFKLDTLF